MAISPELEIRGAPDIVMQAGAEIDKWLAAKLPPPRDLVAFVQAWVGQANTQDRYGN